MFIVKWEGKRPVDRMEWIAILREALCGELGSYRVSFFEAEKGWRFTLDFRPQDPPPDEPILANTPKTVAFNIHQLLTDQGKPIDPTWVP